MIIFFCDSRFQHYYKWSQLHTQLNRLTVTNDIGDGEVDGGRRVVRLDAYVVKNKRHLILVDVLVGGHRTNDAVETVPLRVGKRAQNVKFKNIQVCLCEL